MRRSRAALEADSGPHVSLDDARESGRALREYLVSGWKERGLTAEDVCTIAWHASRGGLRDEILDRMMVNPSSKGFSLSIAISMSLVAFTDDGGHCYHESLLLSSSIVRCSVKKRLSYTL